LVAAVLSFPARNGDGGGDSGHGGSIPSAGRERAARRSWGRARRRSGRRLAAAGGDGHGGELGPWEEFTGEREQEEKEERGKEEGLRGAQMHLKGVFSASKRQAGGGDGVGPAQDTQELAS
jgi:hypothetical protein